MKNIWLDGIMGLVVGDALGMPVQFVDRSTLKENPVDNMRGYGTYNMPPGTWSDDSSLALATLASIREKGDIDYTDIMDKFVEWLIDGKYTPFGKAFDIGRTCLQAIMEYAKDHDYQTCGRCGEWANGNGALMRIMPVCLFAYEKVKAGEWTIEDALERVQQVSALTHNHLRSRMACGIYFFMVCSILDGDVTLKERLQKGVDDAAEFYHRDLANYLEFSYYTRLFHLDEFKQCAEDEIKSTGYVVDSLEVAIWSLVTTDSYESALLRAVNLGDDTDTVGAIAGGLAGLYYGYEKIPEAWKMAIVKREEIEGELDK